MTPETSVFWALILSPTHAYCFSIRLFIFPYSFVLSPSSLMPCQAHMTEKFADHWVVPSPFSPHFPCREAGLVLGSEPRHSAGSSDPKSRSRAQLPRSATLSSTHLALGLGSITPQDVMDSPGAFKGLCICLQCNAGP